MKRNYQRELDQTIEELTARGKTPRLLLHSCCAPCSSYVLEYLSKYFSITVFYYNPNITDEEEYKRRIAEQKRLIEKLPADHAITFLEGNYEPDRFYEMARGLEEIPEGGERCRRCFALRLSETAALAKREGYDFFTTTLSISPLKDADALNEIGERIAEDQGGIRYLNSDFKKRDGYKRSLELSEEYDLYRQDYCGCVYSRIEREKAKQNV